MNETLIGAGLSFSPELCNIAVGGWLGILSFFALLIKVVGYIAFAYIIVSFIKQFFDYLKIKKGFKKPIKNGKGR